MKKILGRLKNANPLLRSLVLFVTVLLSLSFLFAPTLKPIDLEEINFNHTSSSKLYFKNIRSFYYDIHPDAKSKFVLYRLKRRNTDTTSTWLQFTIVNNNAMDESYIYSELNMPYEQWENPRVLINCNQNDIKEVSLTNLNNEAHYLLAVDIFNALLANEKIYLLNANDTVTELYAAKKENFTAAIALEDYFKLINKL